ncbi:hypothetical protein HCA63_06665 [Listeria booriae]|uniref:phage neck terminator protein n=1 Tax=Listeria booriae TaxID=1552123 RepID=UPI00162522CD|nr:hypothetical protein [Listeria booriae]MBC1888031.1 hypothetical protein [Listeria booriae]
MLKSEAFDYGEVAEALVEAISTLTGGKALIEANSNGEQPDYPFCTYSIISPYIPITFDVVQSEAFEAVFSLTWHDVSGLNVLNLANRTNKWFRSFRGRDFLFQKNIIVVDVRMDGQRDDLISIEYERKAGLDIRLRLNDSFIDEVESIDTFEINNEN